MRVAEDGKLDEDVDGEDAPDEDDQLEGGVEGNIASMEQNMYRTLSIIIDK